MPTYIAIYIASDLSSYLFLLPAGDQVYEGQVVGIHAKAGDLKVNVCKTKQLTNMRAANKEVKTGLDEPKILGLDEALEYINDDEQVNRWIHMCYLLSVTKRCDICCYGSSTSPDAFGLFV